MELKALALNGSAGRSDILIRRNLIQEAAERCLAVFSPTRVHIVTDTHVAPLYLDPLAKQFALPVTTTVIPAGEAHKRLSTVEGIYHDLLSAGMTRRDLIIALGGGVTGDITGFAASSYLRGLPLCQIPTTLLAQVDSSVGGKTGVDLPEGKNLVGAFYQPRLVLIDPGLLSTLPAETYADGMAEVIKYGCIANREILDMISREEIDAVIYECVKIKRDIVEKDEHDTGLRMILNFGHTIGHACEKLENYAGLTHGQAVAVGMVAAMRLSNEMGAPKDLSAPLTKLLEKYNLPTALRHEREQIYHALLSDKKKFGSTVNFILVREFGSAEIVPIEATRLQQLLLKI